MKRGKSKEVAFLNLLKSLIATNIGNDDLEYSISVEDLKEKMEMDKKIISGFLKKLHDGGLLEIVDMDNDRLDLHFERTHDKLLEVISIDDVDAIIENMKEFINRNIVHFNFQISNSLFDKYALETLKGIERDGDSFDMSPIIESGVDDIFNREEVIVYVNRNLFEICSKANEEDLETLEGIFYCCLNLPPMENPFYITLFIAKVCFQMEILASQETLNN